MNENNSASHATTSVNIIATIRKNEAFAKPHMKNDRKTTRRTHVIALNCDMPIFKVAGMLLNMELKGVIRPLPGKLFELI